MNPLSFTASLIAAIELGVGTFKVVRRFVDSYSEVPAELLALKLRLDGINIQLQLLRRIKATLGDIDEPLLDDCETANFEKFMQDVILTFSSIRDGFASHVVGVGKRDRIKWVFHDANKVKKWDQCLGSHSVVLKNILQLLELRYSGLLKIEFMELKKEVSRARFFMATMPQPLQTRFLWARKISKALRVVSPIMKLDGSIVLFERGRESIYNVSFTFQMLFCLKAICVDFKLCRSSLLSGYLSPHCHGLTVKNIIPEDSEIVMACKRGDQSTVWDLLHRGKASVHDITYGNDTPMRWAIESGSLELVSLLITLGADVRGTFGQFNTNYIQAALYYRRMDIARLLLSRGADIHHICARGWTPIFHVWQPRSVPCQAHESIEFLSGASFGGYNAQDSVGWTAMHRAAAFGSAEDVKCLLESGASLAFRTTVFAWSPIFCAVQYGNLSIFNQLIQYHPDYSTLVDGRNWTLLHTAVNAKQLEMIRLLLSFGADPHARSMATDLWVPKDLVGVSVTPGDIAQLRGSDVLTTYLDSLNDMGQEVQIISDEHGGLSDIFWLASEKDHGQVTSA
ncbi:ankyrin [Mollisia scopiformis]|uniref:Ankyrin n=1 Tax=Mollisia scopiformis TaxID=149040 RepID=A0A194X136_MOLSC|nr:ankyrin [Mollisia scopiformis]KUJ13905.1 ankyrin [Mollisia scopiformis]